jgi:putative transposase
VSLEDRKECIFLVAEAHENGARRFKCCETLEIALRTLERWENTPDKGDGRMGPTNPSLKSLTPNEKNEILEVVNTPKFRDLPPCQIVPLLADEGIYLASESSIYRILRASNQLAHRSKSKPSKNHPPKELIATKPNQVWSWDITYLKSSARGTFFYLYLPVDIFSRMIVHWEVHEVESADLAAEMIKTACTKESIARHQISLHSDNGGPMKGATMLATLQKLGIMPSFSRPSVSDDNPISESLFKTLKYCQMFPRKPFESIEDARAWVQKFVLWYNEHHLHSGINFVTPSSRHHGHDFEILEARKAVYEQAKMEKPERWSREIRNWNRIDVVCLNPKDKEEVEELKLAA